MCKAISSTFNSESFLLFTCKISRSGNSLNKSYLQISMTTQNGKLLIYTCCMWHFCALTTFRKGFESVNVSFFLLHNISYKLYYIFGRNADKNCAVSFIGCSNSYFLVKYLVVFNQLEVKPIPNYIIYKSFFDTAPTGHRQRVHKSNFPFWVAFENSL